MTRPPTGSLLEVFPSVQGEGLLVGTPQVFVRLAGCDIRCRYCDTPEALASSPSHLQHTVDGSGAAVRVANPVTPEAATALVVATAAATPACRMVAITGGEPLLQVEFLLALLPRLRDADLGILLETSGLHPRALAAVAPWLDAAAVDLKLPHTTGLPDERLARCLREGLEGACAVAGLHGKLVVTADDPEEELIRARDTVAEVDPWIPVYLTPVSQVPGGPTPPDLARLLAVAALLGQRLEVVRVLPQVHRLATWR
jgi:organic radical activating enzyme